MPQNAFGGRAPLSDFPRVRSWLKEEKHGRRDIIEMEDVEGKGKENIGETGEERGMKV